MKGKKFGGLPAGGKMRNFGGVKAPRENENDKLIAEAKKGTTGILPEGGNALPRLDRPGRKRGGKAC